MLLGGLISEKYGAKYCMSLGGFIIVTGTLLAATVTTLEGLICTYGVPFGIGMGITYAAPIAEAIKWMPEKKALVTGIIVAGFGGGAFVFGQIAIAVVNPDDKNVDDDTDYFPSSSGVPQRVPEMFITLGCCYFLLYCIGILFMVEKPTTCSSDCNDTSTGNGIGIGITGNNPEEIKNIMHGGRGRGRDGRDNGYEGGDRDDRVNTRSALMLSEDKNDENNDIDFDVSAQYQSPHTARSDRKDRASRASRTSNMSNLSDLSNISRVSDAHIVINPISYSSKQAISLPIYWHITSCFVLTSAGGMFLAGTFKEYGEGYIKSERFLSLVAETAAIFNAGGRIFWGYMTDKYTTINTLMILTLAFGTVILTFSNLGVVLGETGFALWSYGLFFCEGGYFSLYMPLSIQILGLKHSSSNYGLIFSVYSVFVVINILVLTHLGSAASFSLVTLIVGTLTLLGGFNLYCLKLHMVTFRERGSAMGEHSSDMIESLNR